MHPSPATLLFVLAMLAAAATAQQPVPLPPTQRLAGLNVVDGALCAAGAGYRATFRADGVEFTTALGAASARSFPLTLRLARVGRGDHLTTVPDAEPTQFGMQARFVRAQCVERYDVSADGLAQSFVFERLPEGEGDLVVQLQCRTDLPLTHADADGLRFDWPQLGGVHIGGVTGVDADGHTVTGTITHADGLVELRLPAGFVDGAAMPLVLDPQIGPVFTVIASALDYQNPDVATLHGQQEYLCVFERQISANDRDLYAVRRDTSGALLGNLIVVASGTTDDHDPAVGSIRISDVYVVAYERGGDLLARSVTRQGVVSAEAIVAMGTDNQVDPDIGSEATTADDECVVIWHNSTQGRIQGAQIVHSAFGTLSVFGQVDLATGSPPTFNLGPPRIAHDGGGDGRYLIVYPRTPLVGDTRTQAVAVDRNLVVLASGQLTTSSDDEDSADVDGNGDVWVVVFENEANEASGDNAILAVPVIWRSQTAELQFLPLATVTALVAVDEIDPVVCMMDTSCAVAWRRRAAPGSSDTEVFMKTIDSLRCRECEPTVLLANSAAIETNLATDSDPLAARAMVVWEASTSGNGNLLGAVWEANDGEIVGITSGCGTAGTTRAACARVGNADFTIQMQDGPTSSSFYAFFVMSPDTTLIACGPCVLAANPFTGFVSSLVPGGGGVGVASYNLGIPGDSSLIGMGFATQWIVANVAGQCGFLGADFASSIHVTVQ